MSTQGVLRRAILRGHIFREKLKVDGNRFPLEELLWEGYDAIHKIGLIA